MNLFSGLLCAAGQEIGCAAVVSALNVQGPEAGRWHRSPRRKSDPTIDEGEAKDGVASFSPDMALGTALYLATKRDLSAGNLWLKWLDSHRPCLAGNEPNCNLEYAGVIFRQNIRGWPRFCIDDRPGSNEFGLGCTMRPGDLANLAQTRHFLKLDSLSSCDKELDQFAQYLGSLVNVENLVLNGLSGLLDKSCGFAVKLNRISSEFNKAGYSQHLVATEILLYRSLGVGRNSTLEAAKTLHRKQPKNPFFAFLAFGKSDALITQVLNQCPKSQIDANSSPKDEWAWEREDAQKAWLHSSIWDCVFMGSLLLGREQ